MTRKNKNVGLWRPSILLPTPAPKCMWLSSGRVPLHDVYKSRVYKNVSVLHRKTQFFTKKHSFSPDFTNFQIFSLKFVEGLGR